MDPDLYKSAQAGNLDNLRQHLNRLLQHHNLPDLLTITNNNLLHVLSQFGSGDYVGCVWEVLERVNDSQDHRRSLLIGQNLLGETALHVASRNGHVNIVKALIGKVQALDSEYADLESGVTLNTVERMMIRATDKHGDTALHNAVKNKHEEIVDLLVSCDLHFEHPANNIGETPLYVAVERHYEKIVDLIIRDGSSPGYKGPGGQTALHAAVLAKCTECAEKLVGKKSGLAKEGDELGRTPLHYLIHMSESSPELARVLLKGDKSTAYVTTITNTNNNDIKAAPPQKKQTNNSKDHEDHEDEDEDEDEDDRDKSALHIAAFMSKSSTMEEILEECPDCWDMVTSKSRNILHLSAMISKSQKILHVVPMVESYRTFKYILEQRWAVNLVNQKDVNGNTPLHLLAKYCAKMMPGTLMDYLTKNENLSLDLDAVNKEGYTPMDLVRMDQEILDEYSEDKWEKILGELNVKEGHRNLNSEFQKDKIRSTILSMEDEIAERRKRAKKIRESEKKEFLEKSGKLGETQLIVAALIATVTFAAGFTLPGGYDGNDGPDQGLAVLIKKAAFKIFVISDAMAVSSSIISVFLHFVAALSTFLKTSIYIEDDDDDDDKDDWESLEVALAKLYLSAMLFMVIAMIGMVVAFITGLYVVLYKGSLGLAISVCCLDCVVLVFMIYKFSGVARLRFIITFVWVGLKESGNKKLRKVRELCRRALQLVKFNNQQERRGKKR